MEQFQFIGAKSASSPGIREEQAKAHEREPPFLEGQEASRYRIIIASVNYFVLERPDTQRATKEASKHMGKPMEHHWGILRGIARYLVDMLRVVQNVRWHGFIFIVVGMSGSDWAGDQISREPTSGECVWLDHTRLTHGFPYRK